MRKILFIMCLLMLVAIPVFAQDGDSAYVRAGHFSDDAPVVDVYVNGELTLEGLDFGDLSEWMEVSAGTYTVAVVPEDGALADAVLEEDFTVSGGDWATITVIGEAVRNTLQFQPIVENLDDITEGLTRIGMFHGVVEFDLITVTDHTDRDLVFGLGYPGTFEGSDGYTAVDVTPGEYTLTMTDEAGNELNVNGPTVMGAGRYYFYAAIGTAEDIIYIFDVTDPADLMAGEVVAEDITTADTGTGELFVRVAHLSSDAPEVDVYLDGSEAVSNLAYTDVTDFISLNGGIYEVALVPAGGTLEDAVYTGQIALFEDTLTLVAAVGFAGDETLTVVTAAEDGSATDIGQARIGFFQSIPTDSLFNLTLNGDVLFQGVAFPDMFEGLGDGYLSTDILAAEYSFGIESAEDGIDLDAGSITMGAGRYYLFIVVGTPTAANYLLLPTDIPE